jgi:hypothetical protein
MRNSLVDGIAQVGTLISAQQVLRLVTDNQVLVAGDPKLDAHYRRNGAGAVLGALVDADAAGDEPPIDFFELGDAAADLVLRPFRAFGVVECDLQWHLHGPDLHG